MQNIYSDRTNLITNPGFESGTSGWGTQSVTLAQSSEQKFAGSYSGKATVTSLAVNPAILWTPGTDLTIGNTYIVSAWFYAGVGDQVFIYGDCLSQSYVEALGTGTWQQLELEAVASATSGNIEFGVGKTSISVAEFFYVDSATLMLISTEANEEFAARGEAAARKISHSAMFSWKKDLLSTIRFFTIGMSTIGGNDVVSGDTGAIPNYTKYRFDDESENVMRMEWDRELIEPVGGLTKALGQVTLDNTSGRYTPRYAGGESELFTASYLPRRPVNLQAGFHYDGIDHTIPQFVGLTSGAPTIDARTRTITYKTEDFMGYLQNRYVDTDAMYTSIRSDQAVEQFLINSGFSTSQYDLDEGLNTIPFALFEKGTKAGKYLNDITVAEGARMYQTEDGIIKWQNRQAWQNFPYLNVQRVIGTPQVIEARTPDTSHIINVVEIKSKIRTKRPEQIIFRSASGGDGIPIAESADTEVFIDFQDPVLTMTTPGSGNQASFYRTNSSVDGTGSDMNGSVSIVRVDKFARAAKLIFRNASATPAYLTELVVTGRPAQYIKDIYYRDKRGISVTAFEEQPFLLENDYIQDETWADSYAQLILDDYSNPTLIQELVIMAIPELQFGDLISWQGQYWRVYAIKSKVDPAVGYVQELRILQQANTLASYFRIGVSVIGGTDRIAS